MLDHLQAEGLADDTIVVVLSDHGESLGAHRMIEKGPSMYEESLGIPFIVRWPGRIDGGRVSDALFSTVDLPITLGHLCDVPVDAGEGRSFGDAWTSDAPGPARRDLRPSSTPTSKTSTSSSRPCAPTAGSSTCSAGRLRAIRPAGRSARADKPHRRPDRMPPPAQPSPSASSTGFTKPATHWPPSLDALHGRWMPSSPLARPAATRGSR